MKKILVLPIVTLITTISSYASNSQSWEDILSNLKNDQGKLQQLNDSTTGGSGSLYNANITYTFGTGDGDGKFSDTETATVTIKNTLTGKILTSPTNSTPDQLEQWAKENADDILASIFGNDPYATVSGSSTSVSMVSEILIDQIREVSRARHMKKGDAFDTSFSTVIMMDSEKSNLKEKDIEATSSSFRFTYDKELNSKNDIGFLLSYKDIKSDDAYSSKSKNLIVSPYYKYYYDVNDHFDILGVANGILGVKYMKSSLFDDGFGYLEYGAGITALPNYYLTDKLTVSFPIGVQTIKKNLSVDVPDSVEFLKTAINNMGFQTSLNYGLGLEYAIKDNWFINTDALKTQEIGSTKTALKDKATYYSTRMTYHGESWDYVLGYKTIADIDNLSEDAYMLSIKYGW
jgi:hypothetical protein